MDPKRQEKLELEAEIRLLTKTKEKTIDDLDRIEITLTSRTKELSKDVNKLTEEKTTLMLSLRKLYKTLHLFEALIQNIKKGAIEFGSVEYSKAKEDALVYVKGAKGVYKALQERSDKFKTKETLLDKKEEDLTQKEKDLLKEKVDLDKINVSLTDLSAYLHRKQAEIEALGTKSRKDSQKAEKLLTEATEAHKKGTTHEQEAVKKKDEILGIIKKALSDIDFEKEKVKGQKEHLDRKELELKQTAIKLKFQQARLKNHG